MNLPYIRKVNSDTEQIFNCTACNQTSTSMEIKSFYEGKILPNTKKIYLCDKCLIGLVKLLDTFFDSNKDGHQELIENGWRYSGVGYYTK